MSDQRATPSALPIADLSLDLDNKWSYLKTHGDAAWEQFPSYLDIVVPHALRLLAEHDLRITVFVVGQDALRDENQTALRSIVTAGHEIGNHSFHHEPWLQRYSTTQLIAELDQAEAALANITSQPLRGFRGPGYSLSADVLRQLQTRGYRYDASTLPTFLGPLARAYYFFKADLSSDQAADRKQLFGSWSDGLRPLKPYRWDLPEPHLIEIPVTTMPIVRAPFHFSYILYLALYSRRLAKWYFRFALWLCRRFRVAPSLLLHPLDFVGGDEVDQLDFFPAMRMAGTDKRALISELLGLLTKHFCVLPMGQRAALLAKQDLTIRPLPTSN